MNLSIIGNNAESKAFIMEVCESLGAACMKNGLCVWIEVNSVEKILSELGRRIDENEWEHDVDFSVYCEV